LRLTYENYVSSHSFLIIIFESLTSSNILSPALSFKSEITWDGARLTNDNLVASSVIDILRKHKSKQN